MNMIEEPPIKYGRHYGLEIQDMCA